jgi:hypothetical protein
VIECFGKIAVRWQSEVGSAMIKRAPQKALLSKGVIRIGEMGLKQSLQGRSESEQCSFCAEKSAQLPGEEICATGRKGTQSNRLQFLAGSLLSWWHLWPDDYNTKTRRLTQFFSSGNANDAGLDEETCSRV